MVATVKEVHVVVESRPYLHQDRDENHIVMRRGVEARETRALRKKLARMQAMDAAADLERKRQQENYAKTWERHSIKEQQMRVMPGGKIGKLPIIRPPPNPPPVKKESIEGKRAAARKHQAMRLTKSRKKKY